MAAVVPDLIDLEAMARTNPSILGDASALHGDDPRPLVIATARSGEAIERALFPAKGRRYYLKPSATSPPAWLLSTVGRAGEATSPWLVYLLLNLGGLGLMLWLTQRFRARPRLGVSLRLLVAAACVAGLLFVGNGFYAFRSPSSEAFGLYFGRVRVMALCMMILSIWILATKCDQWLNKFALVVLLLPIIWGATKISFLALPPHELVTYPWLLTLIAFLTTIAMGPDLLRRLDRSTSPDDLTDPTDPGAAVAPS